MHRKLFSFEGIRRKVGAFILLSLLSSSFSSFANVICPSVEELNKTIGNGTRFVEDPLIGSMRVSPIPPDTVLVAWMEMSVFSGFLTCEYTALNKRPDGVVSLTAVRRTWKEGGFFPWSAGFCHPPLGTRETCVTSSY